MGCCPSIPDSKLKCSICLANENVLYQCECVDTTLYCKKCIDIRNAEGDNKCNKCNTSYEIKQVIPICCTLPHIEPQCVCNNEDIDWCINILCYFCIYNDNGLINNS